MNGCAVFVYRKFTSGIDVYGQLFLYCATLRLPGMAGCPKKLPRNHCVWMFVLSRLNGPEHDDGNRSRVLK